MKWLKPTTYAYGCPQAEFKPFNKNTFKEVFKDIKIKKKTIEYDKNGNEIKIEVEYYE